jgi:hypothetical protein
MHRNALAIEYRNRSLHATGEGERMFVTLIHVAIGGGLVAVVGGLVAQVDPNGQAGQAGYLVAASGIFTALAAGIGTVIKGYLDYLKQKADEEMAYRRQRDETETTRLRITTSNELLREYHVETREYLKELFRYITTIPGAPPGCPEPPGTPEHLPRHDIMPEPEDD